MDYYAAKERAGQVIALLASGEDPEVAHGDQERLCTDVLRDIAERSTDANAVLIAREALRVVDAPGERY